MPEGDEDVEMLNSVSGSQPEAQLVTDKPTELPDGVQVDMTLQKAQKQDTASLQESPPAEMTAIAQDVVSAATQDATAPQDLTPTGFAIPTQDAVAVDTLTATDTPTAIIDRTEVSAVNKDWDTTLQQFLDMLSAKGHLNRPMHVNAFSIAIMKKAMLDFARSRQDILFVLPEEKIKAVLAAGVPYQERKVCF